MRTASWIGVDLDGTLAHYDGWKGIEHVGEPVKPMLARVKQWLARGERVKIFTARVSEPRDRTSNQAEKAREIVQAWCQVHVGQVLEVTNVKDYGCVEIWDDRAIRVEANTGRIIGGAE